MPVSQLNNKDSLYYFDLIKSVDLGVLEYSEMKVSCCFNVYLRPKNGLNKKPKIENSLIKIYRDDLPNYNDIEYDIVIFRRGTNSGKEKKDNIDKQTYKIIVNDKTKIDYVKEKILNFDWKGFKKHQSAPSISKNDILRLFVNK